jgi:hypothetical protein
MRIRQIGAGYYLHDGEHLHKLYTTVIINGRGVVIRKYYKSLVGKELGSLEHIMNKSFAFTNGVYGLSADFVSFLIEEENKQLEEERAERRANNNFDWDWAFDDYVYNTDNPF